MNFDRLKEVTKETIQRENAEDRKTQDILNIFKRFEPERDFIGDRLTKLKINKAVKPQFDENEGFVFKIVYFSDMNRRPELYKTLFQTDSFWYYVIDNVLTRSCKYSEIEIYDANSGTLISNSVFIPEDNIILSDKELNLLRKPSCKQTLKPWAPYYDTDSDNYIKSLILNACADYELIGIDTKAYFDENCNYVKTLSAYTKDSEEGRRYLVEKELNNLLNIDTKNQFIKNYHKQAVEAIEQIDISETIENLLYQTMSKRDYSHDSHLHLHFKLYREPTRQTVSIENRDIFIKVCVDAGIIVEHESESTTLYTFPDKSELTILTTNVPNEILTHPDINRLLANYSLNIKTEWLIHDDVYYDDWYDKLFSIIDKQIEEAGLTIDEKHIIPIDDYDIPQYYEYVVTIENPVYSEN